MTSPVILIEQAITARLRAQRPYSLTVESYGAELDDELFAWVRTLPASWVTFGGITSIKRSGARTWIVDGSFEVLAAQRALVENDARLKDATHGLDVGVYQLLEDNKLLLANQVLGLAIQPLSPGEVRPVMKSKVNRDAVHVYSQTFRTQWREVIPEDGAVPDGLLMTVGLNYLLKPGDNTVDASDVITTTP
ncbi:MAG: phage protein Gp37 [Ramlibacter sp.]